MLCWTPDKTSLFKNSIHLLINLLHGWVSSAGSCCTNDQSTGTLSNQWERGRLGSSPGSVQLITEISGALGTELKSKWKRKIHEELDLYPRRTEWEGDFIRRNRKKEELSGKCGEIKKNAKNVLLIIFHRIVIFVCLPSFDFVLFLL